MPHSRFDWANRSMFSVFERAVFSYGRLLIGNDVRDVEGDVRLDEVGAA
jgi:hypothetical protein